MSTKPESISDDLKQAHMKAEVAALAKSVKDECKRRDWALRLLLDARYSDEQRDEVNADIDITQRRLDALVDALRSVASQTPANVAYDLNRAATRLATGEPDASDLIDQALASWQNAPPSGLLEFDELVTLSGVSKKRVQTVVSGWRTAGHQIKYPCSYELIRPLLLKQWHDRAAVFAENFAEVRSFLDQHPKKSPSVK